MATSSTPSSTAAVAHPIVTDLTICVFSSTVFSPAHQLGPPEWHCLNKDLYLHMSQQSACLYVKLKNEEELVAEDLLVVDIRVGEAPTHTGSGRSWESRPGGLWVLRSKFSDEIGLRPVTEVDVLFGTDAVDPRPHWVLMESSLRLNAPAEIPVARLSVLRGRAKPRPGTQPVLRTKQDNTFKIVQISDTHMVTGAGKCTDAIDAHGKDLPESEADPLTVKFMEQVLDAEKPDLVILTGDQLHHDIPDSQTALFKVVAPIIARSIPFAAVFGNHDSEGPHALSRTAQMSILQNLPFSLSESGPEQVDGTGNFYLQILAPDPSQLPISTLYLLDSHGQIPSQKQDYEPIRQSQIDWFRTISRAQRTAHEKSNTDDPFHLSLVFLHIPVPEFGDSRIKIYSGHRREPTEGPSFNSHFYDALVEQGVSALGCGHDHVNDFCALLPQQKQQDDTSTLQPGPWLCYGGGSGFGGYCSYGKTRFYRQMRVWELGPSTGSLKTWMRVEYCKARVNELVLVQDGAVVVPEEQMEVIAM